MKINSYRLIARNYRNKSSLARKRLFTALVAAMVSIGLSSCLLNRAVDVRDQLCDFDSNFSIHFRDSAELRFHQPVLLDSDIAWLAGASPTSVNKFANNLSMIFVMEKVNVTNGADNDIQLELNFEQVDEQYKLASVQFDPMLNTLINPEFLDPAAIQSAAGTMCDTGWRFGSTQIELDITSQNLDQLPDRNEILELLGQPLEQDPATDSFTYEYRLKSDDTDPPTARFTVWFDESGTKPIRLETSYAHLYSLADFAQKKMTLRVRI
jgi:hypothetical protein